MFKMPLLQVQHELAPKYTVLPPLPEDRFLCSFSHIFAGGYSAGTSRCCVVYVRAFGFVYFDALVVGCGEGYRCCQLMCKWSV
jgi:hypothetical protein